MPMSGGFDASQFAPKQAGTTHPVGKFPATISNTSIVPTKDNDGGMFVVEFTTAVGSILFRYNIWNSNPKAVEIAHGQLSALCHCIGIFKLDWSNDAAVIRGAPLQIEVVEQIDKETKLPNGYTQVSKVCDRNGNEPGKPPAQPAVQPQTNTAPMTQQPGGSWGNPAPQQAGTGSVAPAWGQNATPAVPANPAPSGGWQQPSPQSNPPAPPWANK